MKKNEYEKEFQNNLKNCFAKYYSKMISERIKRGMARKKLSTITKLQCKAL